MCSDPFFRVHMYEPLDLLIDSLRVHYTAEVQRQAAWILGSIDFLGNPIGLFKDVTEGLVDLLQLNLTGGMVKMAHGTFNSAAKVKIALVPAKFGLPARRCWTSMTSSLDGVCASAERHAVRRCRLDGAGRASSAQAAADKDARRKRKSLHGGQSRSLARHPGRCVRRLH